MTSAAAPRRIRRAVRLRGAVQGVGLRPAVFRLARAHELSGFVRNDPGGALVEVEGAPAAVARFVERLREVAGALTRIDTFEIVDIGPLGEETFRVEASAVEADGGALSLSLIPPDLAPCEACLREIDDPDDQRYGYPFTTCTS